MPAITAKCTINQLMMCIKHRNYGKKIMQGGFFGNFFQTNPSKALSFCRLYPFFSKETTTCRRRNRRRGQRGRRCRRFGAWGQGRLGFGRRGWPWSGKKPWRFSMAWRTCSKAFTEKRCLLFFFETEVKHGNINETQKKKTAHDCCLLKHSAFFFRVTHPSLCIAELRFFERPLGPPPTSPQPLEIRLLKPKLARRW